MTGRTAYAPPPTGHQHEIRLGGHVAVVGEVGATLRRYAVGERAILDGFGRDERSTGGRGQVLAPWPNRLDAGTYGFGGHRGQAALDEPECGNAIHGLVRWIPWKEIAREDSAVRLGCVLHPQPAYPWRLELEIEYRLEEEGLEVSTRVRNGSDAACPFGIGFHPYLTLGETSVDTASLTVPAERHLLSDERGLPAGEEPVAGTAYDFRNAHPIGDTRLDTAFTALTADPSGRSRVLLRDPSGRGIDLWADPAFRYFMLYTGDTLEPEHRRRQGIAVEPMTCPPNALRTGRDLIRLEPGEPWSGSWGISPWPR